MIKADKMYTTILLDFDGTLAQSLDLWVEALGCALQKYGIYLSDEEIFKQCFYKEYDLIAKEMGLPSGPELYNHVKDCLKTVFIKATLYPNVIKLLNHCQERKMKIGLVTSSPRSQIETALDQFNIRNYFQTVITGQDTSKHKPDPEGILLAIKNLGISDLSHVLLVGDHLVDVKAGKRAMVNTALFMPPQHDRFYDFNELRSSGPDFVFEDFKQLISYLNENTYATKKCLAMNEST
jgi:HAD superfamily hydrolase (TIGR01549 family)